MTTVETVETLCPVPGKVTLSPSEVTLLNKVTAKQAAIDGFVKTIMQQGEARLAELQTEQRDAWVSVSKAHNIDLDAVDYRLDDNVLVPVRMKL